MLGNGGTKTEHEANYLYKKKEYESYIFKQTGLEYSKVRVDRLVEACVKTERGEGAFLSSQFGIAI